MRGARSVNTRDLAAYLRRIESGEPATGPSETLVPEARARETAVLMLRRTRLGIDRDDYRARTGFDLDALLGRPIARFVGQDLLEDDGMRSSVHPGGPVPRGPGALRACLNQRLPARTRCSWTEPVAGGYKSGGAGKNLASPQLVGPGGQLDDRRVEKSAGIGTGSR